MRSARDQCGITDSQTMLNIFVYGTLRAGETNDIRHAAARYGLAEPRLIGFASMRGKLYDFGRYPGLVVGDTGIPVIGEVYEIERDLVPILDEIEQVYPGVGGLFVGRDVRLQVTGESMICRFYPVTAPSVQGAAEIAGGDWVARRLSR